MQLIIFAICNAIEWYVAINRKKLFELNNQISQSSLAMHLTISFDFLCVCVSVFFFLFHFLYELIVRALNDYKVLIMVYYIQTDYDIELTITPFYTVYSSLYRLLYRSVYRATKQIIIYFLHHNFNFTFHFSAKW